METNFKKRDTSFQNWIQTFRNCIQAFRSKIQILRNWIQAFQTGQCQVDTNFQKQDTRFKKQNTQSTSSQYINLTSTREKIHTTWTLTSHHKKIESLKLNTITIYNKVNIHVKFYWKENLPHKFCPSICKDDIISCNFGKNYKHIKVGV